MTKTVDEVKIAGRSERRRLPARNKPYWRGIDPDIHLGYRKGKRGGSWIVRWRDGGSYREERLGAADDELQRGAMDYAAAVRAARDTVESHRRGGEAVSDRTPVTVKTVIEEYVAMRDARDSARKGRPTRSDANLRLGKYVLGRTGYAGRVSGKASKLAAIPLHLLDEDHLITWRRGLPDELKATTKQRTINDLKAALNEGYASNRRRLPSSLPSVIKFGLRDVARSEGDEEDVARENQILSDSQIVSLIRAAREVDTELGWEGDLYRLVVMLAATGARMSQVTRMRVIDVQFNTSRLMIPTSRKGRGRKNPTTPFSVGSDVLEVLRHVAEGRSPSARLLERWKHKQVPGGIRWVRDKREAWGSPAELLRPWKIVTERAELPDVIPYAFRHSSIVRGLRVNQPIRLVASRHDTSVQMIERHYGRYIADVMDEVSARAIVPLICDHPNA